MDVKQRNIAIALTTLALIIGISAVLSELFDTSRNLASIATWTPVRWTTAPKVIHSITPTEFSPTPTQKLPSVTPTQKRKSACVYPLPYWVYHLEIWPSQISVKGFRFTQETALAVLLNPENEGVTGLLKEYIVASLNIDRGADPSTLGLTVSYAEDWLDLHSTGTVIPDDELEVARSLQESLARFNNGELGPVLCPEARDIPTPVPPTSTPTQTLTSTPRRTIVIGPSKPTPTKESGGPVLPTATPKPTQPPPTNTKVPTDTPMPTDTPVTPTLGPTEG